MFMSRHADSVSLGYSVRVIRFWLGRFNINLTELTFSLVWFNIKLVWFLKILSKFLISLSFMFNFVKNFI